MVSVLIPTYKRIDALEVTLTSLYFQNYKEIEIVVADQNDNVEVKENGVIKTLQRLFEKRNIQVKILKNLPRQGMAQQRQFLLNYALGEFCLYLDDDVILENWAIEIMMKAINNEKCGFAGMAVIGLSFAEDHRPSQEKIEFWEGKVMPEKIMLKTEKWERHKLHNAANLWHVQNRLGVTPEKYKKYKVAWVGGCVLYDTQKLKAVGGFEFFKQVPVEHAGEDVVAQIQVMEKFGGCGIIPSGAYHLELPTTIPNREIDLPKFLRRRKRIIR